MFRFAGIKWKHWSTGHSGFSNQISLFFLFSHPRDYLMLVLCKDAKILFHPALESGPDSLSPDIMSNLVKLLHVTVLEHINLECLGGLECFFLLPCSKSFSWNRSSNFSSVFTNYRKKPFKIIKRAILHIASFSLSPSHLWIITMKSNYFITFLRKLCSSECIWNEMTLLSKVRSSKILSTL